MLQGCVRLKTYHMLEMICRFGQRSVRDDEQNFQNFSLSSKLKICFRIDFHKCFSWEWCQPFLIRNPTKLSTWRIFMLFEDLRLVFLEPVRNLLSTDSCFKSLIEISQFDDRQQRSSSDCSLSDGVLIVWK